MRHAHLATLCLGGLLAACGEPAPDEEGREVGTPPVASDAGVSLAEMRALIGVWTGTVAGSLARANIRATLEASGRISTSTDDPLFCPIDGRWRVEGSRFRASATDECDGTRIDFFAPYDAQRLAGRWSASSGRGGTFELDKSP
jgi:hypothetical protein